MKKIIISGLLLLIFLLFLFNLRGKTISTITEEEGVASISRHECLETMGKSQTNGYISEELYVSVAKSVNNTESIEVLSNENGKIKRALKLSMGSIILCLSEIFTLKK